MHGWDVRRTDAPVLVSFPGGVIAASLLACITLGGDPLSLVVTGLPRRRGPPSVAPQ